ncbi:hypothetical protein PybrP1_002773 [[Pythium] brassicae (nom. inval.)]|nr:hypothetical protein PybrP1_002773 [[Pythium] brassicae (nom. inval.)]
MQQVLDEMQYPQDGAPYPEYWGYHLPQERPSDEHTDTSAPGTTGYDANWYYYYSQESSPATEQEFGYEHQQQGRYYNTPAAAAADESFGHGAESNGNGAGDDGYEYAEASDAVEPTTHADYAQGTEYERQVRGATETPDQEAEYSTHYAQDDPSDVIEAHVVVVDEAAAYEEILAPMPQEWHCSQCTFLNPIAESFCEMCQGHISTSPDMAGYPLACVGTATADRAEPETVAVLTSEYEETCFRSSQVSATNHPLSISTTLLYTPSAPSFEAMEYEDADAAGCMAVVVTPTASEGDFPGDAVAHRIIHPTPVLYHQHQPAHLPPPAPENYLALAFKPLTTITARADGNAAAKTTEYSF